MISPSAVFRFSPARRAVRDIRLSERHPLLRWLYADYRISRYEHEILATRPCTDVYVISYPKAGRTWHRFLLGNYLLAAQSLPDADAADVEHITAAMQGARTRYSHNGANFVDAISPAHPIVADARLWSGKKVIFLARDPKDVLVSAWFHARYRQTTYSGPIADFIRSPLTGIEKLLVAHNRWWDARDRATASLVLTYERMHRDLAAVLRETIDFLGLGPASSDLVSRAVEASSFANMRAAEEKSRLGHGSMRTLATTKDRSDQNARKVRAGRVGGHREQLATDDIAYIDEMIAKLGNPFAP